MLYSPWLGLPFSYSSATIFSGLASAHATRRLPVPRVVVPNQEEHPDQVVVEAMADFQVITTTIQGETPPLHTPKLKMNHGGQGFGLVL